MPFPVAVADEVLLSCGRRCCICHKLCGTKIELHHIVPQVEGGPDTFENCIPLCFDCHAEVGHYNQKHPKGRRFSASELRQHRDAWYASVASTRTPMLVHPPSQRRDWRNVLRWNLSIPLALAMQWVCVSYLMNANSHYFGFLYTFLAPIWIIGLGFGIGHLLKEAPFSAALAGALAVGIISAWAATLLWDGTAIDGFVTGAYFGGAVSFHFVAPDRRMHILVFVASTVVLFGGLGVFKYSFYFARVHPDALAAPSLVIFLGASILLLIRALRRYRQMVTEFEVSDDDQEDERERLT